MWRSNESDQPSERDPPPMRGAPGEWFDRDTMAAIFGMRVTNFDKGPRRYAADEDVALDANNGRRLLFHAPSIIKRWAAAKYGGLDDASPEDRLLLASNPDSPALERWRDYKARIAELDYQQRLRTLVPMAELAEGLGIITSRLRTLGDRIQRRFGPDALDMLNDTLDDIADHVRRMTATSAAADSEPAANMNGTTKTKTKTKQPARRAKKKPTAKKPTQSRRKRS